MLKVLACLIMLVDHIGYVFFPGQLWLRMIGRLAFPLFCHYLSAGFLRTRSRGRYLARLAGWGMVSQIPFSLLFYGGSLGNPGSLVTGGTNVLVTFSLALCGLWLVAVCRGRGVTLQVLSWLGMGVAGWLAVLLRTDYGAYGVGVVLLFSLFREPSSQPGFGTPVVGMPVAGTPEIGTPVPGTPATGRPQVSWGRRLLLPVAIFGWTWLCLPRMGMHPIQLLCVAAIPLLWIRLPDPKPGKWKHAFYAFYPMHLTVLWLLTGWLGS